MFFVILYHYHEFTVMNLALISGIKKYLNINDLVQNLFFFSKNNLNITANFQIFGQSCRLFSPSGIYLSGNDG